MFTARRSETKKDTIVRDVVRETQELSSEFGKLSSGMGQHLTSNEYANDTKRGGSIYRSCSLLDQGECRGGVMVFVGILTKLSGKLDGDTSI